MKTPSPAILRPYWGDYGHLPPDEQRRSYMRDYRRWQMALDPEGVRAATACRVAAHRARQRHEHEQVRRKWAAIGAQAEASP